MIKYHKELENPQEFYILSKNNKLLDPPLLYKKLSIDFFIK